MNTAWAWLPLVLLIVLVVGAFFAGRGFRRRRP